MASRPRFRTEIATSCRLLLLAGLLLLLASCQQTTETAVSSQPPTAVPTPLQKGFELARFHAETAQLLQQGIRVTATEAVTDEVTWNIVIESLPSADLVRMFFEAAGPQTATLEIAGTTDRIYMRGQNSEQTIDWVSLPATGSEKNTFFEGAPGLALLNAERLLKAWEEKPATVSCGDGFTCYSLISSREPGIELLVNEDSYELVSFIEDGDADGEGLQFDVKWAAEINIDLPGQVDESELSPEQFRDVFVNLLGAVTNTALETGASPAELDIGQGSPVFRDLGRRLIDQFYAGDLESLWELMNEDSRTGFESVENLAEAQAAMLDSFGRETLVYEEYITRVGEFEIYERIAGMVDAAGPISLRMAFDADGQIAGFDIDYAVSGEPPIENPNADIPSDVRFELPFSGQYVVQWGGRLSVQNRHAIDPRQQFGYDFVFSRNGSLHRGSGLVNEDFFCFGQPVLAPTTGSVFLVTDGSLDNPPGSTSQSSEYGNHVVLSLGAGHYAFLTNLRLDSIAVIEGQVVNAGEKIGECGNSGASSFPHIHLHIQDGPDPLLAYGVPARFSDYEVAGFGPVTTGEPTSGQTVGNRPAQAGR